MRVTRVAMRTGMILGLALLATGTIASCVQTERAKEAESAIARDCHVHIMSPDMLALLKRIGFPLAKPDALYTDAATILDVNGARECWLISVSYFYTGFGFGEGEAARVRAEHDFLAAQVATDPQRLRGFCAVNPARDYARQEVLRCHDELGLHGLKLHFDNSKVNLRDAAQRASVAALLKVAGDERMPVLVHLHNRAEDFGRVDAERFIELLAEAPPLELYLAHLGGSAGYTAATREVLSAFEKALTEGTALAKHDIHFDISGVVFTESAHGGRIPPMSEADLEELSRTMRRMGMSRFVFGTDYPVIDGAAYAEQVRAGLRLTEKEMGVLGGKEGD